MNKKELAEQIERILATTDTCFGNCDDVKECSHTGHGCWLWKKYAEEITAAIIEAMGEKPEIPSNIEELAAKAIPNHPYPDMNYPGDAVTKISRKSWIEGYKEAMGVQPGMRWVKASERLPEIGTISPVKYMQGHIRVIDAEYVGLCNNNPRWIENSNSRPRDFCGIIEWLDESEEAIEPKGE